MRARAGARRQASSPARRPPPPRAHLTTAASAHCGWLDCAHPPAPGPSGGGGGGGGLGWRGVRHGRGTEVSNVGAAGSHLGKASGTLLRADKKPPQRLPTGDRRRPARPRPPVARHVDDVIHAAGDPVVPVLVPPRAVAREVHALPGGGGVCVWCGVCVGVCVWLCAQWCVRVCVRVCTCTCARMRAHAHPSRSRRSWHARARRLQA